MAVIYMATNTINNKSYIGYTKDFNKRVGEHLCNAEMGKYSYFYNALRKWGKESFNWTIIQENAELIDEIAQIEKNKTFYKDGGYNLTRGGEGKIGYIASPETIEKMRQSMLKKTPTENQINTLRENAKKMRGVPRPEHTKKKISDSNRGKTFSIERRQQISENHASLRPETSGSFYKSKEYKEKMRNSLKGKKRSPESIERYRLAALNRTPEHKENIRLAKLNNSAQGF